MHATRVIAVVMFGLVSLIVSRPSAANVVLTFDGLDGSLDTYEESGFHFDGGEPCFYFCPAVPEGIHGQHGLDVYGEDPFGPVGITPINVIRLDGVPFELTSVDITAFTDRMPGYTEIGGHTSIDFFGYRASGGGCHLGGVDNVPTPVVPFTLTLASCPGIDRVEVSGTGLLLTTDNWSFRVVPEPASLLLLGAGVLTFGARGRCIRAR